MSLEERIIHLERSSRKWKALTILMLLVCTTAVLMGAGRNFSSAVHSERFVLVDPSGQKRGELSLVDNEPVLKMNGTKGQVIYLGTRGTDGASHFFITHGKGKADARIRVGEESSSVTVTGHDWSGKQPRRAAELRAHADGNSEFLVKYGSEVKVRGLAQPGRSNLQVYKDGGLVKLDVP